MSQGDAAAPVQYRGKAPFSTRFANGIERRIGILLVVPTVLAVNVYPLIEAIRFSFQDNKIRHAVNPYIGFDNYVELFSRPEAWNSLRVSVSFVVGSVVLSYVVGLAAAVLLNRPIRGRTILRAAIIVPWAIPGGTLPTGVAVAEPTSAVDSVTTVALTFCGTCPTASRARRRTARRGDARAP